MKSPKKKRPTRPRSKARRKPIPRKKTPSRPKKGERKGYPFTKKALVDSLWATMKAQERANPSVALLHERMTGNLRLIGLTGGIASGKSTVSRFLQEAGIPLIDADLTARDVVQPGQAAYEAIVQRFGRGVLRDNGEIDRARLGAIVFENEKARKDLESITHPAIFKEIATRIREIRGICGEKDPGLIVVDAALLFESGLHQSMDRNILIRTDPDVQKRRLMVRDGLSETEARKRVESQLSNEEKERLAHYVIDNSGAPEQTQRQVLAVLQEILTGSRHH